MIVYNVFHLISTPFDDCFSQVCCTGMRFSENKNLNRCTIYKKKEEKQNKEEKMKKMYHFKL